LIRVISIPIEGVRQWAIAGRKGRDMGRQDSEWQIAGKLAAVIAAGAAPRH